MGIINDIQMLTGKKEVPGATPPSGSQKSVLIVEDEKPMQRILADKFRDKGYRVTTADNGQEGLERIKTQKPDIVIMDLLMPVMSGQNMLQELREINEFRNLPVIVLTNAGEVDNIRQTKTYNNAASFLIKSNVSLDEIVQRVELVLR